LKKIYFEETDDLIDIRYDNVFKAVFTRNTLASKGALSKLISALIGKEVIAKNIIEKPIREMNSQEYWAVFFQYLTDKSKRRKINEIMEYEEGIALASEELITITKDDIERARLFSETKYQLDMQNRYVHAKREGRREGLMEGRQEGLQEGRLEGIKEGEQKIIDLLKSGKSPDDIIRDHGL